MIQVYFLKKSFDVQKAERWFSERKIAVQRVDLTKTRLGRREFDSVRRSVGITALIDEGSRTWKECPARFSGDEDRIAEALFENPTMLRLPIVRNGQAATVGFTPDVWAAW
ncbi:MAG: ArsC family transcriptional regulator [Clostridia bacterium]|nr:ArsC family transcriptional regulator [Clostridia bacterium]